MVDGEGFDRGLRGWRGYGNGKSESGTQELRKKEEGEGGGTKGDGFIRRLRR